MRSFASKLGVSTSTVSEIFQGKRLVTERLAQRFSERLDLRPEQKDWLLRAVKITKSKSQLPDDDEMITATDNLFQKIDLGTFELLSNWYYLAILALGNIKNNSHSIIWLANRLGIERMQARRAFTTLERLDLLKKERNGFRQKGHPISIETKGYESAIKTFLKQHLEKAADALDVIPAEEREISSMTISIDPKNIEKARKMIKRFRRELSASLEIGDVSRVYSLSIQLFPLDQLETK